MIHDKKLNEVRVHIDGVTSDDIIEERKAILKTINEAAIKGNTICTMTMWLEAQASAYGIDSTYDETLDEFDL